MMYYAIIGQSRIEKAFTSLNNITGEKTKNKSAGYDDPIFEETAQRDQERHNQHIKESRKTAKGFLSSINGKQIGLFGKEFMLMDKENWVRYKDAKRFLRNYSREKLDMIEQDFRLSTLYRMEDSHLHCSHG